MNPVAYLGIALVIAVVGGLIVALALREPKSKRGDGVDAFRRSMEALAPSNEPGAAPNPPLTSSGSAGVSPTSRPAPEAAPDATGGAPGERKRQRLRAKESKIADLPKDPPVKAVRRPEGGDDAAEAATADPAAATPPAAAPEAAPAAPATPADSVPDGVDNVDVSPAMSGHVADELPSEAPSVSESVATTTPDDSTATSEPAPAAPETALHEHPAADGERESE